MKRQWIPWPAPLGTADVSKHADRFWSKIDRRGTDECWPWVGASSRGYGMMHLFGQPYQAHRIAYALGRGDIPASRFVLHKCDNPGCCNPNHLFLGTQSDNMQDAMRKGRRPVDSGAASKSGKT